MDNQIQFVAIVSNRCSVQGTVSHHPQATKQSPTAYDKLRSLVENTKSHKLLCVIKNRRGWKHWPCPAVLERLGISLNKTSQVTRIKFDHWCKHQNWSYLCTWTIRELVPNWCQVPERRGCGSSQCSCACCLDSPVFPATTFPCSTQEKVLSPHPFFSLSSPLSFNKWTQWLLWVMRDFYSRVAWWRDLVFIVQAGISVLTQRQWCYLTGALKA